MGTVVEKIQYIEVTKQAIKKAIKNKGVDVSDTDTFRSYAEKIKEIGLGGGGGSSVAEYEYIKTGGIATYPETPYTEGASWFYTDANAYKEGNNAFNAYCGYASATALFDGNEETSFSPFDQKLFFNFNGKPLTKIILLVANEHYNGGIITLYGTNNITYATGTMDKLYEVSVPARTTKTTFEVKNDKDYKFFRLDTNDSRTAIYSLTFLSDGTVIKMPLKTTNMTPTLQGFSEDYMRVITQDWYNGSEIIPSQTLIFKPYEDGGCLINYTDDGKAVNLKMYYIDSQTGISQSQSWQQPVLSSNGELGGDSFAVSSSQNVEDVYKAFDSDNNSYANKVNSGEYIIFYNPERLKISHIEQLSSGDSYSPVNGELYYSDNGNDWFLSNTWNTNSYDVAETKGHKYWKILILQSNGTSNNDFTKINITAEEEALKHKFFVLSPDDNFVIDGDFEKTQVADLNIPERLP